MRQGEDKAERTLGRKPRTYPGHQASPVAHLGQGHQRGDIQLDALIGKLVNQRRHGLARGVGDRNFDVNVLAPRRDDAPLAQKSMDVRDLGPGPKKSAADE